MSVSRSKILYLIDNLGVNPTKRFGQNFIYDQGTLDKIIKLSNIKDNDNVIEIGPGLGSLTESILEKHKQINYCAVEIDKKMTDHIGKLPFQNLKVICDDALAISSLGNFVPTYFISNLPYNTGILILFHFLTTFKTIHTATIMLQAEVINRLTADFGNKIYGKTTVKLGILGNITDKIRISKNVFIPRPNVDSLVIKWVRKEKVVKNIKFAFEVVDLSFSQRRKKLISLLSQKYNKDDLISIFTQLNIDINSRAEQISVEKYEQIVNLLLDSIN